MILTVCPNPCVDCTIEIEDFKIGRLNRLDNKIENLAGKALNSAIGITRLGGKAFATGFMFEGGGKRFMRFLSDECIENTFVWNEGNVRVNYKIIDGKSMMTEINDKGDPVTEAKQRELISFVSQKSKECSMVVISGSLPQGVSDEYYAALIKSVDKNAKVIVDGEKGKLAAALKTGVFMVKPNLAELEDFTGEKYKSYEEMVDGCKSLVKKGAKFVMLSLGRRGAIFTDGTNSYFCKSENVAVNSTVGAGDSMVAASCVAIEKGSDMEEVLRCAVAAGTASITTPGTNLFTKEKYLEIYSALKVAKL